MTENQIPRTYTADGVGVEVAALAACSGEIAAALSHGAQSLAPLTAEALYFAAPQPPEEDTLFAFYQNALEQMHGGRIIARICSFGGNHYPAYFSAAPQSNPAMGFCDVRLLLSRPEWFLPQLRALLRAAAHGPLSILTPMVSNVDEVLRTRALLEEARAQLAAAGVPVPEVALGVTVATPSAAIVSDLIAHYVDFFCIDLHCLTQYVLTTDQNSLLYTPNEVRSKAVLRYVRMAADSARRAGIWCGAMGAAWDDELPALLICLGVTMLSAPADRLDSVRSAVSTTNISALRGPLLGRLESAKDYGILNSRF